MKSLSIFLFSTLLVAGALSVKTPEAQARRYVVPVADSYAGWSPFFFDGYLVYFDTAGRPFTYHSGHATLVPASWSSYHVAMAHYRAQAIHYRTWLALYGQPQYRVQVVVPQVQTVSLEPEFEEDCLFGDDFCIEDEFAGWTPEFYNEHLVYFTDCGLPFYYMNGHVTWIPSSWSGYTRLTNRYRTHAPKYRVWHQRYHQPRYRTRIQHHRVRPARRPRTVAPAPRVVTPSPRPRVESPALRPRVTIPQPRVVTPSPRQRPNHTTQRPRTVAPAPRVVTPSPRQRPNHTTQRPRTVAPAPRHPARPPRHNSRPVTSPRNDRQNSRRSRPL